MQLVCYVKRVDLHYLSISSGYYKVDEDKYIPSIRSFLGALGVPYRTPFVCFLPMPDCANPYNFASAVSHFGDTPLTLDPVVGNEVMLTCTADLQTTAYNAWKKRNGGRIAGTYNRMIRDMSRATALERTEHLRSLANQFSGGTYPEARIYRSITWADVTAECQELLMKSLKGETSSQL